MEQGSWVEQLEACSSVIEAACTAKEAGLGDEKELQEMVRTSTSCIKSILEKGVSLWNL